MNNEQNKGTKYVNDDKYAKGHLCVPMFTSKCPTVCAPDRSKE